MRLEWDVTEVKTILPYLFIDINLIFLNQVHIFKHEFFTYLDDKGCLFWSQIFYQAELDLLTSLHRVCQPLLNISVVSLWFSGGRMAIDFNLPTVRDGSR